MGWSWAPARWRHALGVASIDRVRELERILDALAYELTGARGAGVDRPDELRARLRRARDLLADADALAGALGAERRKE